MSPALCGRQRRAGCAWRAICANDLVYARRSKWCWPRAPVYHHLRDSIEAHLTIVCAALAAGRWIERQTGWSIRMFVKTARRSRTIEIQAGPHVITAADPFPGDLQIALDQIHGRTSAHYLSTNQVTPRWCHHARAQMWACRPSPQLA